MPELLFSQQHKLGHYQIMWSLDRILPLRLSKDDVEYIESLSEETPQFMINGQLQNYLDEKLEDVKMFVEEGENKYEVVLDKNYNFSFKTTKPGKYKLKIIVPFDAEFNPGDYSTIYTPKVIYSNKQTIAETEFEFKPNNCNYVEYTISKADITPRRNIIGRIMDESGEGKSEEIIMNELINP